MKRANGTPKPEKPLATPPYSGTWHVGCPSCFADFIFLLRFEDPVTVGFCDYCNLLVGERIDGTPKVLPDNYLENLKKALGQ